MVSSGEQRSFVPARIQQTAERHQEWLDLHGLRSAQGSFYTPLDVVERVLEIAIGDRITAIRSVQECPSVIDPSCGTGNFLVVAALRLADRLVECGIGFESAIDHVVENRLFGCDIDSAAIEHCARNLSALTEGRIPASRTMHNLHVGNALIMPRGAGESATPQTLFDEPAEDTWREAFPSVFTGDDPGFDVVVGNPPFLNQLSSETALNKEVLDSMRTLHGDAVSKLSNPAAVFFLVGQSIAKSTGTVAFIQPISFLATRDGSGVRRLLASTGNIQSVWICTDQVFDANVSVVTVSLTRGSTFGSVNVYSGRSADPVGSIPAFSDDEATWSRAMSRSRGFPSISLSSTSTFSDMCSVASDFRDQYYGLVGHVFDEPNPQGSGMRLATVGLIDPGHFAWGRTTTKFAKETYTCPVVRSEGLEPKLQKWAESRRCPKVLVATQTRVLECFVDTDGSVLPSVPLITIFSDPERLFHVAAALTSPVVSLVAAERHLGAGISADVLKLSGQDMLRLPLPIDEPAWDAGAALFRDLQSSLDQGERSRLILELGSVMNTAYGVDAPDVLDWWVARLPRSLHLGGSHD